MRDQFGLVRAFFAALNRSDADAVAAFYDEQCIVEQVFAADPAVVEGREAVRAAWRGEFARYPGALPGGHRIEAPRIAGMETGWGWVRADWISAYLDGATLQHRAGYSHFWIENGLIRRHRSVAGEAVLSRPTASAESDRRYPTRPLVGVGAVVIDDERRVLLVKRRHEPLAGQWSLPGGMLDLGETLEAGVAREVLEESGLIVDVGPVVEVFDRILVDDAGRVQYHFVLVDYSCRPRGGDLRAGSDVSDVAFVVEAELPGYRLTEKAADIIRRATGFVA